MIEDQNKNLVAPEKVKRVILCSGQVYYDIDQARTTENKNDIAVLRVEQLCPFPFRYIIPELEKFKNAEVMWVQEEPQNQGPWYFVEPRLRNIMKHLNRGGEVHYTGRAPSASTATGYHKIHDVELKNFLKTAMK